ncbi:hypothetical protein Q9K02_01755 [Qipengyuania sp. G39]|uniref:Uncharacterized protein n=1 Tax=Qipengyuania profundimaris TaxID=3067652 RepID=A0ABT9HL33_9SPHN|nr:hypothetical protein [Qipengyuania sp. G39]MDP4573862.1 hypothetical protein [Qipengyuania sp. G39]
MVQACTDLPQEAAAGWLISRAAQGTLKTTARSEEWVRPTLTLGGEREAYEDCLAIFDGNELQAYLQFAIDLHEDGIPITWERVSSTNVKIPALFWSWREGSEELWDHGSFLGRDERLPDFKYQLLCIEFDLACLQKLLAPYRPHQELDETNIVRLFPGPSDFDIDELRSSRRRRGRPNIDDSRPLKKMVELLQRGEVETHTGAARAVLSLAENWGGEASTIRRLTRKLKTELDKNRQN